MVRRRLSEEETTFGKALPTGIPGDLDGQALLSAARSTYSFVRDIDDLVASIGAISDELLREKPEVADKIEALNALLASSFKDYRDGRESLVSFASSARYPVPPFYVAQRQFVDYPMDDKALMVPAIVNLGEKLRSQLQALDAHGTLWAQVATELGEDIVLGKLDTPSETIQAIAVINEYVGWRDALSSLFYRALGPFAALINAYVGKKWEPIFSEEVMLQYQIRLPEEWAEGAEDVVEGRWLQPEQTPDSDRERTSALSHAMDLATDRTRKELRISKAQRDEAIKLIKSEGPEAFKAWLRDLYKKRGVDPQKQPGQNEEAMTEGSSRTKVEKAIFAKFPPDSKKKGGIVMLTGNTASKLGRDAYSTVKLSDLSDEEIETLRAMLVKD